jgi:hypothetical protein
MRFNQRKGRESKKTCNTYSKIVMQKFKWIEYVALIAESNPTGQETW